jgi:hypothetical protein
MLKKLPAHPIAELFPSADASDRATMRLSLQKNGQLENIVTLDGQVLDGLNRQDILVDDLKTPPIYVDWKDLPEHLTRNGPLEYVKARNFARRQLTASQRAAVGASLVLMMEKQAEEAKASPRSAASPRDDEFSQETGHQPEDESQERGRKKSAKGRSSVIAAKIVGGVSPRSVQRAVAIAKKDPKKFAKVKAGKLTVGAAEKTQSKKQKAEAELTDALKRIANVGGKAFAEVMEKRKRAEVLELSALKDDDILKVRGLVSSGWPVKKAKHYKMTALSRTHTIGDLLVRAISKGVSAKFPFTLEINYEDQAFEITVLKKG